MARCGLGVAAGRSTVGAVAGVAAGCSVVGVTAAVASGCSTVADVVGYVVRGEAAAVDAGAAVGIGSSAVVGNGVDVSEARTAGPARVSVIGAVVEVATMPPAADVAVGAVVIEAAAAPVSAIEADAEVAEAVVDASVIADVGAPITGVPEVAVVAVAPVARGPESSGVWSENPGALNPLITVSCPCPVTGGPDVAIAGGWRLLVVGDRWGSLFDALRGTGLGSAVLLGVGVVLLGTVGRSTVLRVLLLGLLFRGGTVLIVLVVGLDLGQERHGQSESG